MIQLFTRTPKSAFLALAALAFAATPASSQQVRVGIAASVVGDVRMTNATITKPRKVPRRQRLAWGDTIRTKSESKLQILLLDRSSLTVTSNARLTIDRFVYDPGKSRSLGATVTKGAFRFMSGRRTPKSSATVKSPVGTIGIRGTAVDGLVGKIAKEIADDEPFLDGVNSDKDTATLVVLRGPGEGTRGGLERGLVEVSAEGKTVTLDEPILAAYIPKEGEPPIGPFRLSAKGLARVQYRLAPRVADANSGGGLLEALIPIAVGVGAAIILTQNGDDDDNPNNPTTDDRQPCDDPNNSGVC